ncbi:MAG: hypothetical protein HOP25_01660 [Methylotenera sp.]|nr:hypothetical protein [Methylotenera sp.]
MQIGWHRGKILVFGIIRQNEIKASFVFLVGKYRFFVKMEFKGFFRNELRNYATKNYTFKLREKFNALRGSISKARRASVGSVVEMSGILVLI